MRPILDYGLREWLVCDPIRHRIRRLRNIAILAAYKNRKIDRQNEIVAKLRRQVEGKVAVFTVAFNVDRTIEWLANGFAAHAPDAILIVCDNSSTAEARRKIKEVCAARQVHYIPLPSPPLRKIVTTNGSLSHGIALTWIFYNLVRPLRPKVFAFFDHDLIPTAALDLQELVKNRPLYGKGSNKPNFGPWHWWRGKPIAGPWYLWAGYCVYDFTAVADYPLDFTPDNTLKLDTGGQNWTRLYRHLDPGCVRFAPVKFIEISVEGSALSEPFMLVDGSLLHIGKLSLRDNAQERIEMVELILTKLRSGRRLNELISNEGGHIRQAWLRTSRASRR